MAGLRAKIRAGSQLVNLPLGGGGDAAPMTGATATQAGASGLVPAPDAGKQGMFLRGDGTWASPPASGTGATVISQPAISLTDTVVNLGEPARFVAQATAALVGAAISEFVLTVPELNISGQSFPATANMATLSFTVPEDMAAGTLLHVSVAARDSLGNVSAATEATTSVVATPLLPIEITAPADGASAVDTRPTVEVSAFATAQGATDTASEVRVQIARDVAFTDIVWDSGDISAARSVAVSDYLPGATLCHARARWTGAAYGPSPWSDVISFTTIAANVAAPAISSPEANATIICNETGITLKTGAFTPVGGSDTHNGTSWKICTDLNGANAVLQDLESTDLYSHTFTSAECVNLVDDTTCYAFGRHRGERYGFGPWSAGVPIKIRQGAVTQPAILTPEASAVVYAEGNSLTVTASPFGTNAGSDTHLRSSWKMSRDSEGTNIIQEALESTDRTSHVFTNLAVTSNTGAYLRVRYHGKKFGPSPWSPARLISLRRGILTPGGRRAWRHSSGKGTVLVIDDFGTTVYLLVLDAAYRGNAAWDSQCTDDNKDINTDTSLTNYDNIPTGTIANADLGYNTYTKDAATITDAQLNEWFGANRDANTSRQNTSVLVGYGNRMAAAKFCRNVTVDGVACDLPNIQLLARVFCEAVFLDSMDPTVASYPNYTLTAFKFASEPVIWSSTELSKASALRINISGMVLGENKYHKGNNYGVLPVLELAA